MHLWSQSVSNRDEMQSGVQIGIEPGNPEQ